MTAQTTAPDRAEIRRQDGPKSRGGPRTPEGKAKSRTNAVKHGMTASIPVLPGEDHDAFRRRVDDFIDALRPQNAVELALRRGAGIQVTPTPEFFLARRRSIKWIIAT
jgi:hypothetical protein